MSRLRFSRRQYTVLAAIILLLILIAILRLINPGLPAYQLTYGVGGRPTHLIDLDTREIFTIQHILPLNWQVQDFPSPDGRWTARWTLLVENYWWQLELEEQATGQAQKLGEFSACDPHVAWTPDSRKFALSFITDPGDQASIGDLSSISRCEIHFYDVDIREMIRITDNTFGEFDPDFSPGGDQLVFSSHEDGYARLYIMTLATGERRLLTPESFGYRAAWSPDDRWIAFMSNHEEWNDDIYIIAPDGSNMQRLTTDPSVDDYPKWVLAGSVAVNENP